MASPGEIHPEFRLNGSHYGRGDLREMAYELVKEGEPYEQDIGNFLIDWLAETGDIIVQTSGSTGKPGLYRFTRTQMANSARATAGFFGLQPGNRALLCLPARYIGGKMMLVRAMLTGMALDYIQPKTNALDGIQSAYDFCAMVPAQFMASLNSMHLIRYLIIGGAPLGHKGAAAARHVAAEVYETFGMTETISHIALRRAGEPGHTFTTLEGVKVRTDERGCLVVHAPAITDGPVITNDLVRLSSETTFDWLGRIDHVVNSGGIKLYPEQLEEKISPLLEQRFFLTGLPDDKLGEQLVLVVEGEAPPAGLLKLIRQLESIEPYEVPKRILVAPAFAVTPNGKIRRTATLTKIGYGNV